MAKAKAAKKAKPAKNTSKSTQQQKDEEIAKEINDLQNNSSTLTVGQDSSTVTATVSTNDTVTTTETTGTEPTVIEPVPEDTKPEDAPTKKQKPLKITLRKCPDERCSTSTTNDKLKVCPYDGLKLILDEKLND